MVISLLRLETDAPANLYSEPRRDRQCVSVALRMPKSLHNFAGVNLMALNQSDVDKAVA